MKLSTRTLPELRLIARELGIDASGLQKAQIVEAIQAKNGNDNVITVNNTKPTAPSAATNDSGILISPQPEKVKTIIKEEVPPHKDGTKVAIYAKRNLSWDGVGKLDAGFNFVTREVADKWLTLKAVREVSPREVAAHYGVS